jgi:ABC-type uncharacterized transport system auxiliary subunit
VTHRRLPPAAFAAILLTGCLFPAPPEAPRFYAPGNATAGTEAPTAQPIVARLAPVRSPVHLREAVTWRRSEVEYGFYEQRRWTELPAAYVERALVHELFAVTRAPVAVDAAAPLVSVEVVAFEDVLAPEHEARVAVAVTVVDGRCVRLRQTFGAARRLDDDDGATLARGIGEALDEVVAAAGSAIRSAVVAHRGCGA